jgi:hypothetical protein
MRFDRAAMIAIGAASVASMACGGEPRIVRDESIPIERRVESEDRTVAKLAVRDDAVVVAVERQLVCQRGSYEDRVVEEPLHGSGWIWGGVPTILGGVAIANDKNGAAPGTIFILGGAALAVVGVVKLAEGKKSVETKGEATYGASQTCATKPVVGAFVSVTVGADSLAVQSTDATGAATLPIDAASWDRGPLTVSVDLPHEKTVTFTITRDGTIGAPGAEPAAW